MSYASHTGVSARNRRLCTGSRAVCSAITSATLRPWAPQTIRTFLIHLAVEGQGAASTHNGAFQALIFPLIFLSRHVLTQPVPALGEIAHARQSRRVPVVCARQEVPRVLAQLIGAPPLRGGATPQGMRPSPRQGCRLCRSPTDGP